MAKARSHAADYTVYLLIRVIVCVIQALSLEAGQGLARALAWLAYHVNRRHRDVALDNLRQAFPGQLNEPQLHALVRAVYRHFCMVVIEMIHLPRKLQPSNWRRYLELCAGPELIDVLLSGKPVLVVTGHFGNWEMGGYLLAMFGFKTYAVARPLDNPYLERFLRKFRERTGQQLLAKKGDLDRMEEILSNGGIVCTLGDQDAGQRGLFVDFFGRPASTHKAIALLAMEHRAALLVAGAMRVGDPMRYEIHITEIIRPEEYDAPSMSVRSLTQRFTDSFERLVRQDIRQYFWLHRRWKHQPLKRRKAA